MPKTLAIRAYLNALREREPQWRDRIEQVNRVAAIDPSRLRTQNSTVQVPRCPTPPLFHLPLLAKNSLLGYLLCSSKSWRGLRSCMH